MSTLLPGFADPVFDAQTTFRAVLDAMAQPGRVHHVTAPATPPPPLDRATASVLLTLIDAETPLWLDPAAAAAREWIAFHGDAPLVEPGQAHFALALGTLPTLPTGTDEEPERSATLILQVASLAAGPHFVLQGPGLAVPSTLSINGLPPDFVTFWAANRRLFPRGIDVILTAGNRLAALPRTVSLEPA